jgi:hypothetical protein
MGFEPFVFFAGGGQVSQRGLQVGFLWRVCGQIKQKAADGVARCDEHTLSAASHLCS